MLRAPLARNTEDISDAKARTTMMPVSHTGVREILMSSVPNKEKLSVVHINGMFAGKMPLRKSHVAGWPESSTPHLQCLHCGGQCDVGPPMPAARFYESQIDQYWLYGPFCRPCCSLGYICETDSTSKQLAPTIELLRIYFGNKSMHVAPPRASHKRFGGPLSDADFYGSSGFVALTTLQPPFVTFANYVVGMHQVLQHSGDQRIETENVEPLREDEDMEFLLPQSAGKLVHLERPSYRKDPVAQRMPTGKEPLILKFLANLKSLSEINDVAEQVEIKIKPLSKKRKQEEAAAAAETTYGGASSAPPPNGPQNFLKQYFKKQ